MNKVIKEKDQEVRNVEYRCIDPCFQAAKIQNVHVVLNNIFSKQTTISPHQIEYTEFLQILWCHWKH